MKFTEEQVKEAFFKMFNESGEWFFVDSSDREWNRNATESTYLEFLDTLVEIAGGYKEDEDSDSR